MPPAAVSWPTSSTISCWLRRSRLASGSSRSSSSGRWTRRLGDRDPLLLAARHLGHALVGVLRRADRRQRRIHGHPSVRRPAPEAPACAGQAHADQVTAPNGVADRGGVVLGDVADARVAPAGWGAQHLDPTTARREEPEDHLEERGLARNRWAR